MTQILILLSFVLCSNDSWRCCSWLKSQCFPLCDWNSLLHHFACQALDYQRPCWVDYANASTQMAQFIKRKKNRAREALIAQHRLCRNEKGRCLMFSFCFSSLWFFEKETKERNGGWWYLVNTQKQRHLTEYTIYKEVDLWERERVWEREKQRDSLRWSTRETTTTKRKHIPCTLPLFPYGTADDE